MSADGPLSFIGAAERLVGTTLLGKWKVLERIQRDPGITGQSRSVCYRAEDGGGRQAFVKAFDFRREERERDTDFLERAVREYNHERNIHLYCRDRKLSRVTQIIGSGDVPIGNEVVHFIICEWAQACLRERQPPGEENVPLSDRFLALRNTTAAMSQLHALGIAHQDIKPSNAVFINRDQLKLADLGSSTCEHMPSPPHDLQDMAGQPNYAPYELLYGDCPTAWKQRRFGCDLYLLGNLLFTSLVGSSLTIAVLHALPESLRPGAHDGRYDEVVPMLIDAHQIIVSSIVEVLIPAPIQDDVTSLIWCLCHPDPAKRGHPRNVLSAGNQYGLERIVSKFEMLAFKAKLIDSGRN